MSQEQWLGYLLHNLPESTGPYRDIWSTNYHFSVSNEEIEEYGDETSATNHSGTRAGYLCHGFHLLKCPPDDEAQDKFIHKIGTLAALTELVRQLKMYARQEGPFSSPPSSDTLSWWRALSASLDANILAFLAIRIYSASVNSMVDEWTASNFTWFNSGLRNHQNVGTLTRLIQICQCGPALGKTFFVRISVGMISVWAPQENQKSKPLERPVVAFCNIENEIYAKANKQVVDLTVEDLSEDEGDQDKDVNPADKDSEFNLDDDVDLGSPLLDGVLSDRQPTPDQENITASTAAAARLGTRNHEPTEDDWKIL